MWFEPPIWQYFVWIFAILFIIFGELVALTKYNPKYDKLNKTLIFLMYLDVLLLPFFEQIRMGGTLDFYALENFQLIGTVYLGFGLIIFVYALINLFKIIKINMEATNGNATPESLLTNGYYGKVRHPMFGSIILVGLGWLVAWGSIIGLGACFFVSLIFLFDAIKEEETQLIPKFGDEYLEYRQRVPAKFFTRNSSIFVIALVVLAIVGTILAFL